MMGFQLSRSQTVHVRNTVIHGLRWVRGKKKKKRCDLGHCLPSRAPKTEKYSLLLQTARELGCEDQKVMRSGHQG